MEVSEQAGSIQNWRDASGSRSGNRGAPRRIANLTTYVVLQFHRQIWVYFPVFCLFVLYLKRSRDFTPDPLFFRSQVRTSFQVCLTILTNGADPA